MPVMLSVPRPSLAAKLVGHILSIIWPRIPHKPETAREPLIGDLVGELDPFSPFLPEELLLLFLLPVIEVELYLRVGDFSLNEVTLVVVVCLLTVYAYFLCAS